MKKSILIIALLAFVTIAFGQAKKDTVKAVKSKIVLPAKADSSSINLTKTEALQILAVLNIANKGLPHTHEIAADELTFIQEMSKKGVGKVIFDKYFNKDGTPKK